MKIIDHKNNVFIFEGGNCLSGLSIFAKTLSRFLTEHPDLEVTAIVLRDKDGYCVTFRKKI